MILHLCGEVDYKMFDSLVFALNNLKTDDNLAIYFSSPEGGSSDVAEAIIDLINKNKEYVGLVFYGENFSAGMCVLLRAECKKYLLPDTKGMYHFAWQEMIISEGGKPSDGYDIFSLKEMKKSKLRSIEYLKTTKLSPKEINDINKGKDVYFSFDRLLEII